MIINKIGKHVEMHMVEKNGELNTWKPHLSAKNNGSSKICKNFIVNFPLIFKLGLNSACKSLLITTPEYLLQYATEYKTEK